MFNKLVSGIEGMQADVLTTAAPIAIFVLIVGAILVISGKWKHIGWMLIGGSIIGFIIALLSGDIVKWLQSLFGGGI